MLHAIMLLRFTWWRTVVFRKPRWGTPLWRAVLCRLRNHPCGPVFYTEGLEPDWTCKECGDYLG